MCEVCKRKAALGNLQRGLVVGFDLSRENRLYHRQIHRLSSANATRVVVNGKNGQVENHYRPDVTVMQKETTCEA
jgi:hypothetical protein